MYDVGCKIIKVKGQSDTGSKCNRASEKRVGEHRYGVGNG